MASKIFTWNIERKSRDSYKKERYKRPYIRSSKRPKLSKT